MTLNIISFNLQNIITDKNYDGGKNVDVLAHYINKIKPDIICVQELTDAYENKLKEKIKNYNFTGKNRFKKSSIWYNHFGEKTAIITNQKTINTKTYSLSKNLNKIGKRSFLSIFPRIATVTTIQKENQKITIINTHLDHLTDIARKKQLTYLKQIIEKENNPIILTGDFNLNTENKLFQNFTEYMKTKNCTLISNNKNTFKPFKNPLKISYNFKTPDHIFIPKQFKIENIQIKDLNISDHKLINIKIKS